MKNRKMVCLTRGVCWAAPVLTPMSAIPILRVSHGPSLRPEGNLGNRTSVKLKALLGEGVAASPQLPVLLQHQHTPAGLGQQRRSRQATDAAAHHDGIEPLGHLFCREH